METGLAVNQSLILARFDSLMVHHLRRDMKKYRSKRRSCGWCKPNKMGHEPRYTAKELDKIERMEKEIREKE